MVNVCLPGTYPTTSPDLIWRSNQFGFSKNTTNIIIISQYLSVSVFTFLHILFVLLLNKTLHLLYVNRNSINTKEQTRTLKHDHPPKGTTQLSSPVYLSLIFFLPIAALEIACSADRHFLPLSSFNFYWNWWAHFFSTSTRLLRSHHHHLHYYHTTSSKYYRLTERTNDRPCVVLTSHLTFQNEQTTTTKPQRNYHLPYDDDDDDDRQRR